LYLYIILKSRIDGLTQWRVHLVCRWHDDRVPRTEGTAYEDSDPLVCRPSQWGVGHTREPATSYPISRETSSRTSDAGAPVTNYHKLIYQIPILSALASISKLRQRTNSKQPNTLGANHSNFGHRSHAAPLFLWYF